MEPSNEARAVLEWREAFDAEAWAAALAEKALSAQAPEAAPPHLERKTLSRLAKSGALLISNDGKATAVGVQSAENPNPRGSFGFVGTPVEVKRDANLRGGTLVVSLDPEEVSPVVRQTLRLF